MVKPSTRAPWRHLFLSSTLVALALPLLATSTSASETRVVVEGVAPLAQHDVVVNQVITTTFDLALTQRHQADLKSFIASLSDSGSANFHHYLTPAQYGARFGASTQNVTQVSDYLRSFGLEVGSLSKGRNILRASGTTSEIARAFDTKLVTVREGNGALAARLSSPATIPSSLSRDVSAVAGLTAVQPVTSISRATHAVVLPGVCPSAGSAVGVTPNLLGGYTIGQQAQLYGLSGAWAAGTTGAGQTIGVYELANYNANDVATYLNCYGVASNVTSENVDGGPTQSDNASSPGSSSPTEEATLDVEEAAALAPGAKIVVYQGTNNGNGPTDIYSQMASDNTASIISTSWGICEAQNGGSATAEQTIFQEMAAQGQTVVAAAGDSGSADCLGAPTSTSSLAVDDPASQPYVTGVGGLSVTSISPLKQHVWNDHCTNPGCGAGGGGESMLWSQPSWQTGNGITGSAATGGMRMVPDLSVMADPATGFIEYYSGPGGSGWSNIGGTSIGAPLVSSLLAVAAQGCDASNSTPGGRLGFINPSLYRLAATGFNDVTTGTNDLFGAGVYSAGLGYDMASGLGSPNGAAFFAGLCPPTVSSTNSVFNVSSKTALSLTNGPTVSATLRDATNTPIANANVDVTASAPGGILHIDNDHASANGIGNAKYQLMSDANGNVAFSVFSSVAQVVNVTINYEGKSIYSTSITFTDTATKSGASKPNAPSITKLAPLVGGFTLKLKASTSNGGSPITAYQYSINNGATWSVVPTATLSINVTRLKKGAAYNVVVRAINAIGPSATSAKKKVVTRL